MFINYYECERCGERWEDEWDCACDDRCPNCNTSIQPYCSDDLQERQQLIKEGEKQQARANFYEANRSPYDT